MGGAPRVGSGYGHFEVLGGGSESALRAGLQYRPFHHTEGLNMQIKRLLDDREVLVGERVFGAQGRSNSFVEHSGGELVVSARHPVN